MSLSGPNRAGGPRLSRKSFHFADGLLDLGAKGGAHDVSGKVQLTAFQSDWCSRSDRQYSIGLHLYHWHIGEFSNELLISRFPMAEASDVRKITILKQRPASMTEENWEFVPNHSNW
mmetsp:Transcript_16224/g.44643  ORF Transcript_16224/g.44643 Transcript_16224/m.44643 type:complete len:117 (-) Transcript_16224:232-582(-)